MPAATGNPKRAEPEHREITAGRTPASSRARAAPTTEARAPLPPVAMSARRLPSSQSTREGLRGRERPQFHGPGPLARQREGGAAHVVQQARVVADAVDPRARRGDHVEVLAQPEHVEGGAQHGTVASFGRAAPMTSAKPSDRHSTSTSWSGTAVVSTVMPMQHDPS